MIGKLKGVIDSYGDDWVIIDVGGVGYHVFCSAKTHAALPPAGEAAQVFTEMLVSDSAIRLVGFATQGERTTSPDPRIPSLERSNDGR